METKLDKMRLKLEEEKNLFFDLPSMEKKIEFLLRYAILAPSTHNTQPWLFRVRDNTCEIVIEPRLRLEHADKTDRDIYISLGCALENLILAARYYGLSEEVLYSNNSVKAVFSEKSKNKDENYDKLRQTILSRVNTRGGFADEKIPVELIAKLKSELKGGYCTNDIEFEVLEEKNKIIKIAELTMRGMKLAHSSLPFRKEMSKWIVHNYTKRRDGMIGYSMNMPGLISFFVSPMVRLFNLGAVMGRVNYIGISSAPLIFIVSAPKNEIETWIRIGRLVERAMLEFNSHNYSTSIYLASIEMGDLYKEVQKITSSDSQPQFIFAAGKMNKTFRTTPRHEVEEKLST